jgi:DNA-binding transcriptional MerR regulator
MSIGKVLGLLRADFPDVTISKIRFLEAEGLIEPDRTSSGYRKFTATDVERLRFVLSAQRDHYLPLRVIKERLEAFNRRTAERDASVPASDGALDTPAVSEESRAPGSEIVPGDAVDVRLTREELMGAVGMDALQLAQLEEYGLIAPRAGSADSFDGNALVIARLVRELAGYGLEPRHLRAFKAAADREVGLVEQVVAPLRRQRNPQSRVHAERTARDLMALSLRLHAVLVKAALTR